MQGFRGAVNQVAGFLQEDCCQLVVHGLIVFRRFRQWRRFCQLRFFCCLLQFIHFQAEVDLFQVVGELLLELIRFCGLGCGCLCQRLEFLNQFLAGFSSQPGRHLIHHVNQLLMAGAQGLEYIIARRQALL